MVKPVKTIGNPVSWTLDAVAGSSRYMSAAAHEIPSSGTTPLRVNHIGVEDLKEALRKGREDFTAFRSDVMFIVVLYPIMGLCLAAFAFNRDMLPLLFPLMSGFALIGPVAATGLYEMSRRRERGEDVGWGAAFAAFGSPAIGAIVTLGLLLVAIFITWMLTAALIHALTMGAETPASLGAFVTEIFTTGGGWAMLIIGCAVGFVFAAAVLAMTIVSIPLLLDRHVGVPMAISTSLELTRKNPRTVAIWGMLVAALLVLGTIPLFLGLIFVLPILGHATWHLYRRAVS